MRRNDAALLASRREGDAVPVNAEPRASGNRGSNIMRKTDTCRARRGNDAASVAAAAQDFPVKGGDYWTSRKSRSMTAISAIMPTTWRRCIASRWTSRSRRAGSRPPTSCANVNKRVGEPDLYLVTIADRPTTPAEDEARAKEINAYLQPATRQRMRRAANARNIASSAETCCFRSLSTGQ